MNLIFLLILYHFQKLIVCDATLKTVLIIRRRAEQSQQKTLIFLGLILFFTHSTFAHSLDNEKIKAFSSSTQWKKILYFYNNTSMIDSPNFFLSKDKKNLSPYSEAVAAYRLMLAENFTIHDEHPICKFPARFFLLVKEFNKQDKLSLLKSCTKLSKFLNRMDGASVSLVFSSYYLNNPSSAFGHTFLKVNRSEDARLDLLNYGINYAATVGKENPFLYAFKGLFGFFKGEFTAVPYYYKVREYNDFESRDLWEYKLNFSPEEMLLLRLHIWELGRAWSHYYFLSENCSTWAIKVLEAIKPNYNLSDSFGNTVVIPAETIKSLYKFDNFVKEVNYRPSLRTQILAKTKNNSKKQVEKFKKTADQIEQESLTEHDLEPFSSSDLNTILYIYDYKYSKRHVSEEDILLKKKTPLLTALSKKESFISPEVQKNISLAPHNSHPPRRLSLAYADRKDTQESFILAYKQGYHTLVDSSRGFNSHMALNFFDLSTLIYQDTSSEYKLLLDHLYLISIDAFTPLTNLEQQFSWRVNFGLDNEFVLKTYNKPVAFVNFDSGYSWGLNKQLLYFLISNRLEGNGRFNKNFRFSLSPLIGTKISLGTETSVLIEAAPTWSYDFDKSIEYSESYSLEAQSFFQSLNSAPYLRGEYKKLKDFENYFLQAGVRYFF